MQVSVVSDDYSQITRALDSNRKNCNDTLSIANYSSNSKIFLDNNADKKQTYIKKSIKVWKNFCHQQILNGKLDIIA